MRTPFTRKEKLLFASPLLFLAITGMFWVRQQTAPLSLKLPDSSHVWQMRFSPDGRRLMALITDGSTSNITIRVFDLESRSKLRDLSIVPPDSGTITYYSPEWSADGKQVVSLYSYKGSKARAAIWDVSSGEVKGDYAYPFTEKPNILEEQYSQAKFSADGKTLIGGGGVLDTINGKPINTTEPAKTSQSHTRRRTDFLKEYDRSWEEPELGLTTVRKNNHKGIFGSSRIWVIDTKTKRTVWQPPHRDAVDFKWRDKVMALLDRPKRDERGDSTENARLFLWDGKTRKPLPAPPILSDSGVKAFEFHPDHRSIVYCTNLFVVDEQNKGRIKNELIWWDFRQNRVRLRVPLKESVFSLNWSPSGKWLVATGTSNNENRKYVYSHTKWVFDLKGKLRDTRDTNSFNQVWSPDEKQMAIADYDSKRGSSGYFSNRIDIKRFED